MKAVFSTTASLLSKHRYLQHVEHFETLPKSCIVCKANQNGDEVFLQHPMFKSKIFVKRKREENCFTRLYYLRAALHGNQHDQQYWIQQQAEGRKHWNDATPTTTMCMCLFSSKKILNFCNNSLSESKAMPNASFLWRGTLEP